MSERKVLNKYIPPNFDPEKIPKARMVKGKQHIVRLMAPFSMRCKTCGEYIYKGRKFNARKETVLGEDYLGIKIFRFYIRCTLCAAEITFKTDPQHSDYVAEHGATRNTEPWREEATAKTVRDQMRAEEEARNPMKSLELKSVDAKKEMQLMEALDDIRAMNARAEKVQPEDVLSFVAAQHAIKEASLTEKRRREEADDELLIQQLFQAKQQATQAEKKMPLLSLHTSEKSKAGSWMNSVETTRAALGIVLKKPAS
jgi:Saf4/Yju2 protein